MRAFLRGSCAGLMVLLQTFAWALPQMTKAEAAKHNTPSSCYMIIDGSVYDVTRYLAEHESKHDYDLKKWCGREASQGWADKDGKGKPHSRKAAIMLKPMKVAVLAPDSASTPASPEADLAAESAKIEERIAVIGTEMRALAKEIGAKASSDAKQATTQLNERLEVLRGQLNVELDRLAKVSAEKAKAARKSAGELLKQMGESLSGD